MKKPKEDFAQRLRAAMGRAGYEPRPAVLEREFNQRYPGNPITLHGVRRWLLGETVPRQDKLVVLAEWLRVDPQQLRYGGEEDRKVTEQPKRWGDAINLLDRELFETFLGLSTSHKRIVREIVQAFARANPADSGKSEK